MLITTVHMLIDGFTKCFYTHHSLTVQDLGTWMKYFSYSVTFSTLSTTLPCSGLLLVPKVLTKLLTALPGRLSEGPTPLRFPLRGFQKTSKQVLSYSRLKGKGRQEKEVSETSPLPSISSKPPPHSPQNYWLSQICLSLLINNKRDNNYLLSTWPCATDYLI